MRLKHNYIGKIVLCMLLFYGGIPYDIVTCEAIINCQYIHKNQITLSCPHSTYFLWNNFTPQVSKVKNCLADLEIP